MTSDSNPKDNLFDKPLEPEDFVFDETVAAVFDDMLDRSVPFYGEVQEMIVRLCKEYSVDKTRFYDLGCSTANTISRVSKELKDKQLQYIGYDNSESMLQKAKEKLQGLDLLESCELRCQSLDQPIELSNASVVTLLLTLQFIRPLHREALIKQIFDGLIEKGVLILFEKVLGEDSQTNRLFIDLYYEYKKKMGYSELEISQKREALENILIPYTVEENKMLLRGCGFQTIDIFFKWNNFAGFLAIK